MISIDQIKKLRQETGISISECKKALEKAGGDEEKAKIMLREWGEELAEKKSEREAGEGIIESYVHSNKKVGILLDLRCESDFVARSDNFQKLAHEICLQIAAMKPLYVAGENIPENILENEKKIYQEQMKNSGKPENIIDKIIEGKIEKYKKEICLMSQLWVKDGTKTIKELVDEYIAKLGENIIIKRFTRYEI